MRRGVLSCLPAAGSPITARGLSRYRSVGACPIDISAEAFFLLGLAGHRRPALVSCLGRRLSPDRIETDNPCRTSNAGDLRRDDASEWRPGLPAVDRDLRIGWPDLQLPIDLSGELCLPAAARRSSR